MDTERISLATHFRGAFQMAKWKAELLRLGKERQRIEQDRDASIAALGEHAWERQVREEVFAPVFDEVAAVEDQRSAAAGEIARLKASIAEREAEKEAAEHDHGRRIAEAEAELTKRDELQDAAEDQRKAAEKERKKLQGQQKSTRKSVDAARDQLGKAAAPEEGAPDPARVEALRREIATGEGALQELEQKLERLGETLEQRQAEEREREAAVERQTSQLEKRKEEKKSALEPLEDALKGLRGQVEATEARLAELGAVRVRRLAELGRQVEAARPSAAGLAEDFHRLDGLDASLRQVAAQSEELGQQIAAVGSGTKWAFYGTIAAGLLLVVAAVWLAIRFL